jgi:enamine deaminase RidA (YjgF/YER057c/UK114 family)
VAPSKYPEDLDAHIAQAFKNVEAALKVAGGKGWEEVYSVTTYHVPLKKEALEITSKYFKEYMTHKPLWTAVGVPNLAEKEMQIEIVVKAKSQW